MVFIYATSQPNIHLNSSLLRDPKMQYWLSDGSPVFRKLQHSVFLDMPGAWTNNSWDQK